MTFVESRLDRGGSFRGAGGAGSGLIIHRVDLVGPTNTSLFEASHVHQILTICAKVYFSCNISGIFFVLAVRIFGMVARCSKYDFWNLWEIWDRDRYSKKVGQSFFRGEI